MKALPKLFFYLLWSGSVFCLCKLYIPSSTLKQIISSVEDDELKEHAVTFEFRHFSYLPTVDSPSEQSLLSPPPYDRSKDHKLHPRYTIISTCLEQTWSHCASYHSYGPFNQEEGNFWCSKKLYHPHASRSEITDFFA